MKTNLFVKKLTTLLSLATCLLLESALNTFAIPTGLSFSVNTKTAVTQSHGIVIPDETFGVSRRFNEDAQDVPPVVNPQNSDDATTSTTITENGRVPSGVHSRGSFRQHGSFKIDYAVMAGLKKSPSDDFEIEDSNDDSETSKNSNMPAKKKRTGTADFSYIPKKAKSTKQRKPKVEPMKPAVNEPKKKKQRVAKNKNNNNKKKNVDFESPLANETKFFTAMTPGSKVLTYPIDVPADISLLDFDIVMRKVYTNLIGQFSLAQMPNAYANGQDILKSVHPDGKDDQDHSEHSSSDSKHHEKNAAEAIRSSNEKTGNGEDGVDTNKGSQMGEIQETASTKANSNMTSLFSKDNVQNENVISGLNGSLDAWFSAAENRQQLQPQSNVGDEDGTIVDGLPKELIPDETLFLKEIHDYFDKEEQEMGNGFVDWNLENADDQSTLVSSVNEQKNVMNALPNLENGQSDLSNQEMEDVAELFSIASDSPAEHNNFNFQQEENDKFNHFQHAADPVDTNPKTMAHYNESSILRANRLNQYYLYMSFALNKIAFLLNQLATAKFQQKTSGLEDYYDFIRTYGLTVHGIKKKTNAAHEKFLQYSQGLRHVSQISEALYQDLQASSTWLEMPLPVELSRDFIESTLGRFVPFVEQMIELTSTELYQHRFDDQNFSLNFLTKDIGACAMMFKSVLLQEEDLIKKMRKARIIVIFMYEVYAKFPLMLN